MNNSKHNPKTSLFLKRLFYFLVDFIIFLLFLGCGIFLFIYYKETPPAQELSTRKSYQTSIIYDRTGEHILYEIHGEEDRKIITQNEIPDTVKIATIAAEDKYFYQHRGIDPLAIIRAIRHDIRTNEYEQGASTITQQLARNVFLTREKTLKRKLLEAVLAIKIEREFSKDEILAMYLNQVPYGSNAYGIEAASETFFGKHAKDLTLDEAALIAALPKAPTYYSPYGENVRSLKIRQLAILDQIKSLEFANSNNIRIAKETNTLSKIVPFHQNIDSPHFVFYVKEELEDKFGQDFFEKGGYKIYTTLDYDKQKLAEKIIQENALQNERKFNAENAALVSIDPKTGQILAMVGSRNYFDKDIDGQVNVTVRPRQPGSSFKPFVYGAAFEKGIIQPENLVYDVPTNFGPDGSGKDYIPNNYDGKSHGPLTIRQALSMSLNIPAVKVLYLTGVNDAINFARRLGITTLTNPNRYGLSLVLGGGDVTLLDETSGFGVFANDGKRIGAHSVLKITATQGKVLYTPNENGTQVIDPQIARKIDSILSDNDARTPIFGSHSPLIIPGRTVAAKTGTTQEFRDAWTVGFTPSLVTGIWTGNNDNSPMKAGADGVYVAAPIWNKFMSQVLQNYPNESFPDYDHGDNSNLKNPTAPEAKITYYNNKTGKYVSEKKAKKTDPKKIDVKVEWVYNTASSDSSNPNTNGTKPLNIELLKPDDPIVQKWRYSVSQSYAQDVKNTL